MLLLNAAPKRSLTRIMLWVLLALVPAILMQMYFWGEAVYVQLALGTITALGVEAVCLKLSHKPVFFHLKDGTAIVTAWLLALSLPPFAPWFVIVVGTALALILAKHAYGGVGQNIFNPAMVGFALVIIAFPREMSLYAHPFTEGGVKIVLGLKSLPDALSGATPLDLFKHAYRQDKSYVYFLNNIAALELLSAKVAVAMAYFIGGILLIWRQIITWWVPFLYLTFMAIFAGFFSVIEPESAPLVWLALSQGAIVVAAFFILTDPVTAPVSITGKIVFVALCASFTFIIRTWSHFPDGVAFAVLLSNLCVPMIDRCTIQTPFGGFKKQATK